MASFDPLQSFPDARFGAQRDKAKLPVSGRSRRPAIDPLLPFVLSCRYLQRCETHVRSLAGSLLGCTVEDQRDRLGADFHSLREIDIKRTSLIETVDDDRV